MANTTEGRAEQHLSNPPKPLDQIHQLLRAYNLDTRFPNQRQAFIAAETAVRAHGIDPDPVLIMRALNRPGKTGERFFRPIVNPEPGILDYNDFFESRVVETGFSRPKLEDALHILEALGVVPGPDEGYFDYVFQEGTENDELIALLGSDGDVPHQEITPEHEGVPQTIILTKPTLISGVSVRVSLIDAPTPIRGIPYFERISLSITPEAFAESFK